MSKASQESNAESSIKCVKQDKQIKMVKHIETNEEIQRMLT